MWRAVAVLLVVAFTACGGATTAVPSGSAGPPASSTSSPPGVPLGTPGKPGPRRGAALAWDPVGGYALMFGGIVGVGGVPTGQSVYADTWVWTDSRWLAIHPPTSPPGRSGASLGYDPLSKRMILYGGGSFYAQDIDPSRSDTW